MSLLDLNNGMKHLFTKGEKRKECEYELLKQPANTLPIRCWNSNMYSTEAQNKNKSSEKVANLVLCHK